MRDEGESARCPLLLIHGAAGSSVVWIDVLRRLSGRRRVVAPDLPGHGQSEPWHELSISGYGEAVGTLCSHLGIGRAVVLGHSMGGAIALRLALDFPDRVAGLVLCSTAAHFQIAPAIHAVLEKDFGRLPEWFRHTAYSPKTPREVVDRWVSVAVQAPQEIAVGDFRALDGFDVRDRLRELRAPALVICGEDDLLTPPQGSRQLVEGIPGARFTLLPRAGHMVFHEQPDGFHAALDPFLAEAP